MPALDSDLYYQVTRVTPGRLGESMRRAVFRYALGDDDAAPARAGAQFTELRKLWRARLESLREAGWPPAVDGKRFRQLRNCPPFGVKTNLKPSYPCRLGHVCPFCYARDVVAAPASLLARFVRSVRGRDGLTLARFEFTYVAHGGPESLLDLIANFDAYRSLEADGSKAAAGAVTHGLLVPGRQAGFVRRGLLVCDPARVPVAFGGERRFLESEVYPLTIKAVAAAVPDALYYQGGLLRARAEDLVRFLAAFEGRKLSARYGALRDRGRKQGEAAARRKAAPPA